MVGVGDGAAGDELAERAANHRREVGGDVRYRRETLDAEEGGVRETDLLTAREKRGFYFNNHQV